MNPASTGPLAPERPHTEAPSIGAGMPPPVIGAVLIEALLSVQSLLSGHILWAGAGLALCVGVHRRVVIAQRLVLIAALLGALLVGGFTLAVALSVLSIDEGPQLAMLGMGLAPGLIYVGLRVAQIVALTRPDAQRFFGLDCPACGSHAFHAKSPTYRRLECRACGHAWRSGPRASGGPQPTG